MKLLQRTAMMLGIVVGCAVASGAQAAASAPVAPLRLGVAAGPKTLDPLLAADAMGARLLQLTHPALLLATERGVYAPLVAGGCTQTTLQRLHCTLPQGRRFTSGAPLDAATVVRWLQQVQSTPRSPLSGAWRDVSITTPGPLTLAFALPSPTLTFMATLADTPLADPASPAHGMGPYVAAQEGATGTVTLTPSPTVLNLPALQFTPLADATTRLLKLQKGELDALVQDLPPTLIRYAQQEAPKQGWQVVAVPSSSYTYLALNFRNPLLAEPSVREALSVALNRVQLRAALLGGMAAPALSLLPPGHPATFAAREDVYDPLSAESLLEETALPDGRTLLMGPNGARISLTLLTSTDALSQRIAQALQAQWKEVGIDVELRSAEWASFFTSVQQGQFDMALLSWSGLQQPPFYHQVFHSLMVPPNGLNRGAVNDPQLDALTAQIMEAPTQAAQVKAAMAAQQRVAELRPYIPLWRRHHVLVLSKAVQGCSMGAAGDFRGLMNCRRK